MGSIAEGNKEIVQVITTDETPQKKGPYLKVIPECKAKIAKFASIVAARKYSKLVGKSLNESTVHSWVKTYKLQLEHKRKAGDIDTDIEVLPMAKRGCPFLPGEQLDGHIQAYIPFVHDAGGVIATAITIAAGKAI